MSHISPVPFSKKIVPTREVCCNYTESRGYSWVNSISNFDNVLEGYLSLFQIVRESLKLS